MYDTIVVGAGIAGVCAAFWLKEAGEKVLLVDKKGLLAGASGAAGAFLSPRLGKGGPLQRITNEAYLFALDFYRKYTPEALFQKGLARIPKDEEDAARFEIYREYLKLPFTVCGPDDLPFLSADRVKHGAICFEEASFVDPAAVAKKLTADLQCAFGIDAKPVKEGPFWRVEKFRARNLLLCTGADKLPIDAGYISIGGLWGERVDLKSGAEIPKTVHQRISVSANIDGIVRIGATHVRGEREEGSEIERINALVVEAIEMVPALADQRIVRIYAGRRSSVSDHFPVAGELADLKSAYEKFNAPPKSLQPESDEIPRMEGCYISGCFGGRGFVFAPMVGKMAADKILEKKRLPKEISADRLLLRHLRKSANRSG